MIGNQTLTYRGREIAFEDRRLLTRGVTQDALGGSDGGLYNPGAYLRHDGTFGLVVRREFDYSWTQPCIPHWFTFTNAFRLIEHCPLTPTGHDTDARLEDFRPFRYEDDLLVAHTRWKPHDRQYPIKPVLSKLNAMGGLLTRYDDWLLPLPYAPVEKNWILLERHDGLLATVYSLSPLVIYTRSVEGVWYLSHFESNDWEKSLGKPPRNSTHLLPFRDGYLGWWHTILDGAYVTGAYWLNADLKLVARTGILLDGHRLPDVDGDVYKPRVLYVSSQVITMDRFGQEAVFLFYGEGDAHSGVITVSTADIAFALGLD